MPRVRPEVDWTDPRGRGRRTRHDSPGLAEATDALTLAGLELTVDMTAVTFMDSSGLNTLLHLSRRACREGAILRLSGVPEQALCVLEYTGASSLFFLLPSSAYMGGLPQPGAGRATRCEPRWLTAGSGGVGAPADRARARGRWPCWAT